LLPFKERKNKIVSQTFNGFGLVVPVKNDVGYRPIPYSLRELKQIFKRMNNAKLKNKKIDSTEIDFVLGNVCLADDEGDPGMGYELGIDLFYSYPMFEKQAKRLLINAYSLTKSRDKFKLILNAHLDVREKQRKGNYNYNQLLNIAGNKNDNTSNKEKKRKRNDNDNGNKQKKLTAFFKQKKDKKENVKNTLDELSSDSE